MTGPTCPACGTSVTPTAKFCAECGAGLATAPVRQERKVVTVLFCDLVGFTQRSHGADPEDVRALVRPFHELLRSETDRYGGTLARIVGDAGMLVFGYPTAHADDPERAVRAGLAILAGIHRLNADNPGLDLHARVGVNTSEAVVTYGSTLENADDLMGDGVNLAARLQAAAAPDTVLVGETTYLATRHRFAWEALDPVVVKGVSDPIPVYRPSTAVGRIGRSAPDPTRFVGRDDELTALLDAFRRVRETPRVEAVTIVGEPGMGKSRLLRELARELEALPDLVTWRVGHSLPYGEGAGAWPIGEIIKAHAGILESDDRETAGAKLDGVLAGHDAVDRAWYRRHLGGLAGAAVDDARIGDEAVGAWVRFFGDVARGGPTVLVVEDLHWADDLAVAFLERLLVDAPAVPILLVATARPEVKERHPAWIEPDSRRAVITLQPLPAVAVAELVRQALGPDAPSDLAEVAERAGGSPLYAEQLAALMGSRSTEIRPARQATGLLIPPGLHALLAARIDGLPAELKASLLDASVQGRVFWSGALAQAAGHEPAAVEVTLRELERLQLVREVTPSSMRGSREFAFWHALTQDVAYATLPRLRRSDLHTRFADWLEGAVADRLGEHAEILVHHRLSALEAAGGDERIAALRPAAVTALLRAGERGGMSRADLALARLERALELARQAPPDPSIPHILREIGFVARIVGLADRSRSAAEAAVSAFEDAGDVVGMANALGYLSDALSHVGDPGAREAAERAVALARAAGAPLELSVVLERLAGRLLEGARYRETLAVIDESTELRRAIGEPPSGFAPMARGLALAELGDPAGLAILRAAADHDAASGHGGAVLSKLYALGWVAWPFEGPAAAVRVFAEAEAAALRFGLPPTAQTAARLEAQVDAGELRRTIKERGDASFDETRLSTILVMGLEGTLMIACAAVGDLDGLPAGVDRFRETPVSAGIEQWLLGGLIGAATASVALGDLAGAEAFVARAVAIDAVADMSYCRLYLPKLVRAAVACGRPDLVEPLVQEFQPIHAYAAASRAMALATIAEAREDAVTAHLGFVDAESTWAALGVRPEQGLAQLGAGKALVKLGRNVDAAGLVEASLVTLAACDMEPAMTEAAALLERIRPVAESVGAPDGERRG